MTSAGWSVIRWARSVPTVRRRDGRPDHAAHHVLLVLATYADKDGRARPSLSTLADDARLTDRATREALERLQEAGLVSQPSAFNGTPVWTLNLELRRDETELTESERRRAAAQEKAAARAKRYRERLRDAAPERDVTPSDSVTSASASVTPSDDVRHAVPERESRRPTTYVTLSTPSQPQVRPPVTATELPLNCQGTATTAMAQHGDEFERFWSAYPKKVARKDAERVFERTVRKGHQPAMLVAEAERWAALWAAENREQRYIPNASTWLYQERWTDTPPAPRTAHGQQQRPSTTDQRIADAQALKQRFASHLSNQRQITSGAQS